MKEIKLPENKEEGQNRSQHGPVRQLQKTWKIIVDIFGNHVSRWNDVFQSLSVP